MRELQALGGLQDEVDRLADRERPVLLDQCREVFAVDISMTRK